MKERTYTFASILLKQYPAFSVNGAEIVTLKSDTQPSSGERYTLLKDRSCSVYFVALDDHIILVTLNDTLAYNAYERAIKLYSEGV
jgi:hypothetical protein